MTPFPTESEGQRGKHVVGDEPCPTPQLHLAVERAEEAVGECQIEATDADRPLGSCGHPGTDADGQSGPGEAEELVLEVLQLVTDGALDTHA